MDRIKTLVDTASAISAVFHSNPGYDEWYEKYANNGGVGGWDLCADAAYAFHNEEMKRNETEEDVFVTGSLDGKFIDVVYYVADKLITGQYTTQEQLAQLVQDSFDTNLL